MYSTLELDLHADTIVCGSNYITIHFTGKEWDNTPYNDAYKTIKAVPIIQASTAYNNTDIKETKIIILNEAICMGEIMDYKIVKPNQLRAQGMKLQDNHFAEDTNL